MRRVLLTVAVVAAVAAGLSTGFGAAGASHIKIPVGQTVLMKARTQRASCTLANNPDRQCSPGAYYTRLTKSVVCSPSFHTSDVRDVPTSLKHDVEIEYGLTPKAYGRTLEIDHIISLELGGSNDVANLFPEKAPGYHAKDKLENRLHKLVCSGAMTLRAAQVDIARNWQALYARVYDGPPIL
jgi:hypothetical protein